MNHREGGRSISRVGEAPVPAAERGVARRKSTGVASRKSRGRQARGRGRGFRQERLRIRRAFGPGVGLGGETCQIQSTIRLRVICPFPSPSAASASCRAVLSRPSNALSPPFSARMTPARAWSPPSSRPLLRYSLRYARDLRFGHQAVQATASARSWKHGRQAESTWRRRFVPSVDLRLTLFHFALCSFT